MATVAFASQSAFAQTYNDWTVAQITDAFNSGSLNSVQLTQYYVRIALYNPTLHAVIETDPQALVWADQADKDRVTCKATNSCSPLLGIPVLLNDNIATRDLTQSTAGSWVLYGNIPTSDAFVVSKLRKAGAVLLGKSNLSELNGARGASVPNGWSGRGGQTVHPFNATVNVGGGSSGAAVAATANLAAITLGYETDGSIILPAASNGVVGLKPTVGLVSRSGVLGSSKTQDSVGPIARSVADAALLLDAIVGTDPNDASTAYADSKKPTSSYSSFVHGLGGPWSLAGVKVAFDSNTTAVIGFATGMFQYALGASGVTLPFPQIDFSTESIIVKTELKAGFNAYLADLQYSPVRTLASLIKATTQNALENAYGVEGLTSAQNSIGLQDPAYLQAKKTQAANAQVIDQFFAANNISVFIGYSETLSHAAALAGYPILTLPAGTPRALNGDNTPYSIGFIGLPYSEPILLNVASTYEQFIRNAMKINRAQPPGY
ncbi:UNVERIFIED_CONTAM: hypothetical protein HDU68_005361 [Siphonaria sp. JEL0065]|nr:hypothetical protein HDU68_005361 [Siphonaria sp. JEL0065]